MNEKLIQTQLAQKNQDVPSPRREIENLKTNSFNSEESNTPKHSIFRGEGILHPISKIINLLSKDDRKKDKERRLRPLRRQPRESETINSPSRYLEAYLNRLRYSGELEMAEQMKLRFMMWTEEHTSVIPLIYEKLMEKDKQEKKLDKEDKEKSSVKKIEDSINTFLAKYDPLTQLSNFIFTGRTPKQVVDDINKGKKDKGEERRKERVASGLGIPKNALSLAETSSESLMMGVKTYDEQMHILSASRNDILRYILQEITTIRKHGFSIENIAFKEPVGQSIFSKILEYIQNIPDQIPGFSAFKNIIKAPTAIVDTLSSAGAWMRDKILGEDFLKLQSKKEAEKAAGIDKSLDTQYKEFIVKGLPNLLEDIRLTGVSQLEVQRNLYQVLKNQYELLSEVHTGKMDSPLYQYLEEDLKERKAYDPYEAAMLTAEALEKAEEKRTKQRRQARESAFERGILGWLLGGERATDVADKIRGITQRTGGAINLLGDNILEARSEGQERGLERSQLHKSGRAEDVIDFSEARARKRREFEGKGGAKEGIMPLLGTLGGLGATAATGGLALPLMLKLGGMGLGARKYAKEKGMQRRDFFEYSDIDVGRENVFERMAQTHGEELGKSTFTKPSFTTREGLGQQQTFTKRIVDVLGFTEKRTLKDVIAEKFDVLKEALVGKSNENIVDNLKAIDNEQSYVINLNRVKNEDGTVSYKLDHAASKGGKFNPGQIIVTGEPGEDEGSNARLTGREEIIRVGKDGILNITGQKETANIFSRRGIKTRSDIKKMSDDIILAAEGSEKSDLGMKSQLEDLREKKAREKIADRWDKMINYLAQITETTDDLYLRQKERDKKNQGIFGSILSKIGDLFSMFGPLVSMALPVIGVSAGALGIGTLTEGVIGGKAVASLLDIATRKTFTLFKKTIDKVGSVAIKNFSVSEYIMKTGSKLATTMTTGVKNVAKEMFEKIGYLFPRAAKVARKLPYEKIFGNLGKWTAKYIGPTALKKVPGLGAIIGFGLGMKRIEKGQYIRGLLEIASGAFSTIPIAGTAVSLGIDSIIALSDLISGKEEEEKKKEKGLTFGDAMARLTKHIKGMLKLTGKATPKLLKKVPGLGAFIGFGLGMQRFKKDQYLRGAGEIASGLASIVPGVGTAVSLGIDSILMLTDYLKEEKEETPEKPKKNWILRFSGWIKDKVSSFFEKSIRVVPFFGNTLADWLFSDKEEIIDKQIDARVEKIKKESKESESSKKNWILRFSGWAKDKMASLIEKSIRVVPFFGNTLANWLFSDKDKIVDSQLESEIKRIKKESEEDKTSKKNWISEFKEYLTKKLKGLTEYIIRGIPGGGFLADWLFDEDKSLDNSGSSRGRFKTRDERLMEREVQKRKREREKSKTSQSKNNGDLDKLRDKLSSQKDTAKYIRDSSFERPSHQMGITGTALKNKDKDIVDDNITVSDLLKNELDEKTAKLLKHQLTVHEGIALKKYIDSRGYPTIGVGHKIESDEKFPKKISYSKAMELFSEDLIEHTSDAKRLPFFNQLDSVRKAAIIDMVYNMGVGGVKKFRSMTQYLKEGDYKNAASEILNSRYSEQVGKRAESIAKLIKSGDPKYFNIGEPQIIAADRGMITSRPTPTIVGEENRPEAVVPLTKERFRNFTRNIDIDSLRNERDELLNSDDNIQESSNIQTNVNNQNEQQPRRENNKPMILNTPSINSGRRDDEKPTKTKIDDDMDMIIDRIFNNSSATFIETVKEYTFGNTASHKFY